MNGPTLINFDILDLDDLRRIILKSPTKTSLLDPMPTVKDFVHILLPSICHIVNRSLQQGYFPETCSSDTNSQKIWFRHCFLSKVIERVLLDLSAAFDTIDIDILLDQLEK